jgi:hypothetical protein
MQFNVYFYKFDAKPGDGYVKIEIPVMSDGQIELAATDGEEDSKPARAKRGKPGKTGRR